MKIFDKKILSAVPTQSFFARVRQALIRVDFALKQHYLARWKSLLQHLQDLAGAKQGPLQKAWKLMSTLDQTF